MIENNWLVLSILALMLWGVAGVVTKLATNYFNWKTTYMLLAIGYFMTYSVFYLVFRPEIKIQNESVYGISAGILGVSALLFYYLAMTKGKTSIVVPLTAMYPLVTIILSFLILKEKINLYQGVGILFAVVALVLMSLE